MRSMYDICRFIPKPTTAPTIPANTTGLSTPLWQQSGIKTQPENSAQKEVDGANLILDTVSFTTVASSVEEDLFTNVTQLVTDQNSTVNTFTESVLDDTFFIDNDFNEFSQNITSEIEATTVEFITENITDRPFSEWTEIEESGSGMLETVTLDWLHIGNVTSESDNLTQWNITDGFLDLYNGSDYDQSTKQQASTVTYNETFWPIFEELSTWVATAASNNTSLILDPHDDDSMQDPFKLIGDYYGEYHTVAETYIMTSFASLGLILNAFAIAFVARETRMWPVTRGLHFTMLLMEELFLALIIAFIHLRNFAHQDEEHSKNYLEVMNYFTAVLGAIQTIDSLILYVTATDCFRSVCLLSRDQPSKLTSIRRAPFYMVFAILVIMGFYSAYLPPVRAAMYQYSPDEFAICNSPLENHWDFVIREVDNKNLFYILYYSLGYLLIGHIIPFFYIACRDKDIVDVLHEVQEKLDILCDEHERFEGGMQQSATGLTGQSSDVITASAPSMEKINTKVIPDTSAVQHANWLKAIRAAASSSSDKTPKPLPDSVSSVICPAVAMSVICNVYLVCSALKLVLVAFKLFQFADNFIPEGAIVGFNYLNVYSNFLMIVKSSMHAGVLFMYNMRIRHMVTAIVYNMLPDSIRRRYDSDFWDDEENNAEQPATTGAAPTAAGAKQKESKTDAVDGQQQPGAVKAAPLTVTWNDGKL